MSKQAITLIRADGSKAIGMGHIKRAGIIADMLKEQFGIRSKLIMKEDEAAKNFANRKDLETIVIPQDANHKEEIESLDKIVEKERPSLFVLDVLENDTDDFYMSSLRKFNLPIAAVTDDSKRRIIDADIVLNGNPCQIGQDYSDQKGEYLVGPMYFLMESSYADTKVKEPVQDIKRVLLTFGGSDHNNLLFRILDVFKRLRPDLSFLIISSEATGYLSKLKEHIDQLDIDTELLIDVESLLPFWGQCDLAITAGGNTLFERIATRLPGATLCQLPRQTEIADRFESLGVNVNLGFGPEVSDEVLYKRLRDFLDDRQNHRSQYSRAPEVTDGGGLIRFGKKIKTLLEG